MRLLPGLFRKLAATAAAAACLFIGTTALGREPDPIGVNYGPFHRPGQSPHLAAPIPAEQIESDLGLISAAGFEQVRIFGLANGLNRIVPIAHRRHPHLKLWVGVYVCGRNHDDPDDLHHTRAQMNEAARLANAFDNVTGIVVGNECLAGEPEACREPVSVAQLVADIESVRRALTGSTRTRVRVTSAMSMLAAVERHAAQGAPLGAASDVVMVNVYPFYNGTGPAEAVASFGGALRRLRELYGAGGKPIVVGETGWPSAGPAKGAAVPGRDQQAFYLQGVSRLARAEGLSLFIFEMFDEPWKSEAESIGPHWGLCDGDGRSKFNLPFPWTVK